MKPILVLAAIGLSIWLGVAGIAAIARTTLSQGKSFTAQELVSTSFVDSTVGWAVAQECSDSSNGSSSSACRSVVYGTSDGGTTWTVDSRVLLTPRRMTFVDRETGWLIGSIGQQCGSNICQNVIMLTQDGGKKWNRVSTVAAELTDMAAVSAYDFWAVGHACRTGQKCTGVLVRTNSGGQLWDNAELPFDGQDLRTVRVSPSVGWVSRSDSAGGADRLAVTRDGGNTWQTMATPCTSGTMLSDFSLASDGWMTCSPASPSVTSGVSMYHSGDMGVTWQRLDSISSIQPASTTSSPLPTAAAVSAGGEAGLARSLTVASPGYAWVALATGRLISAPVDGGPVGGASFDETPRDVRFIDPSNGWLAGSRSIWQTVDGGRTWSKHNVVTSSGP